MLSVMKNSACAMTASNIFDAVLKTNRTSRESLHAILSTCVAKGAVEIESRTRCDECGLVSTRYKIVEGK